MGKKSLTEYVCQYWHEFYYGDYEDGCWVTEKTVSSKEEAEAWKQEDPDGEHTYYEVKTSSENILKDQLQCLQEGRKSDLPKDVIIDAYKDVISKLEEDWRVIGCDKDGKLILPEQNRPLLLLIKSDAGKVFFKTQIFDSWTQTLFQQYKVIAWKYIQPPAWFPSEDFEKSFPKHIVLNYKQPTCEI